VTSGVRLGSPAATTRGFGQAEFQVVGGCIVETLHALATQSRNTGAAEACVAREGPGALRTFSDLPEMRGTRRAAEVASLPASGRPKNAEEVGCAVRFAEPTIPK